MNELEAKVEVNGTGKECRAEFTPTRAELLVLVKYYHEQCLVNDFFNFQTGQLCFHDRGHANALERIKRIEDILGDKDVRYAMYYAEEHFRKKCEIDPLTWRIVKDRDRGQWEEVQRQFRIDLWTDWRKPKRRSR